MSKPTPPSYRTANWRSYNAALKQRGSLLIWFDPETQWLGAPSGKRGRSATFSDAAIQACLTLKALVGLPLRQTTGLVASLMKLAGLEWAVPVFSTLSRRPSGLNAAIPYRPSTGALCRAQRLRRHTRAQERSAMAGKHTRCPGQERHRKINPPGPHDLAALERVSPAKPGRDQNAVLQAAR